jgi:hypothetical protein
MFNMTVHISLVELSVPISDNKKFDLIFVDSPKGRCFVKFSRLNTVLYARSRTDLILLHDCDRIEEKNTVNVLEEIGWVTVKNRYRLILMKRCDRELVEIKK